MQVMLSDSRVTFFKMHLLLQKMQVVVFRKALLAFFMKIRQFFLKTGPKRPKNKGRIAMDRPSANAKIRNFQPESKLC